MTKTILVEFGKCTGCEVCIAVCSAREAGVYDDSASRIHLHRDESRSTFVPLVCGQCPEHPCVAVCPVNAIRHSDRSLTFAVDTERCTGCGACAKACRYLGIFVHGEVAAKCDLCDGNPRCVTVCYAGALRLAEVPDHAIVENLQRRVALARRPEGNSYE